jgi:hypothetical protein
MNLSSLPRSATWLLPLLLACAPRQDGAVTAASAGAPLAAASPWCEPYARLMAVERSAALLVGRPPEVRAAAAAARRQALTDLSRALDGHPAGVIAGIDTLLTEPDSGEGGPSDSARVEALASITDYVGPVCEPSAAP